jgi:hypothetical protein
VTPRTSLGRVGRPLLGVAVFAGALVIWEVWARHAGSFLVSPASEVLDRAWHVWPTKEFLADVAHQTSIAPEPRNSKPVRSVRLLIAYYVLTGIDWLVRSSASRKAPLIGPEHPPLGEGLPVRSGSLSFSLWSREEV